MDQRLRYFYEETRIKNASAAEMLVMLYDYLVQKAETAETELAAETGSAERVLASRTISHCIDIVTELTAALRPEYDPQLCANLSGLYRFFAEEFSEALAKSDPRRIGAILPLIRKLRAAWSQAQKTAGREQLVAA
jgi:flagellar biosynthetic protein FliS